LPRKREKERKIPTNRVETDEAGRGGSYDVKKRSPLTREEQEEFWTGRRNNFSSGWEKMGRRRFLGGGLQ